MSHLIKNVRGGEGLPPIELISPKHIRPRLKKYVQRLEMEINGYFCASDRYSEIEGRKIEHFKQQVCSQLKQIRNSKIENKKQNTYSQPKYNAQMEVRASSIVQMKQIMKGKENAYNQLSTRNASRLNISKMHFLIKRRIDTTRKDESMRMKKIRAGMDCHGQYQDSLKLPHCA